MLRIIATSRAPLHIGGEQEYQLGTLVAGDPGGDAAGDAEDGPTAAARLFVDRARSVQPGWEPGAEEDVVEQICRLVDGLPLGIELAAARITLLPPAAIRDRLAARLPLPGSGPRDVPARQRTLDGTIAWSYELLEPGRRRLVRELAVFEGGFDLEQVRRVATLAPGEDALDALFELVDRSLIARSAISGHRSGLGSVRFRMLETIRTFALRELVADGTEPETRRRHAEAMLELAETAAPHLPSADQGRWLDRLGQDHANLASALRWAVDAGQIDIAQRLSWATWRYWQLGGHLREGRALADAVIDMPGADEPSPGRMWSFAAAGGLAYWQADTPRAGQLYRAELETAGQIGHLAGQADAWYNLSATEAIGGNREEAVGFLQSARERYRELGDEIGHARTDWGVANILLLEGGREMEGVALVEAARRKYAEMGDTMYESLAAGSLAFAYQALGRPVDALRIGVEAIAMTHAIRDVATTTIGLADAAILLLEFQRNEEAATLMGAYNRLCDLHGVQPPAGIGQLIIWSRVEERAIENLSSGEHAAATRRGQAMSLDEAVAFVVATAEDVLRDLPAGGTGRAPEPA
jgi:predicted ATPase